MKYPIFVVAAALVTLFPAIEGENGRIAGMGVATAQQMGNQAWNFTPRSRSLAAQFQFQRNMNGNGGTHGLNSGGGLAALEYYVTQYNSSSTSIGNLNEITQILSGGSTGTVGQSTQQAAHGNQGSSATTDTTVTNSSVTASGEGSTAQGGLGDSISNQTASESSSNGEQSTE